MPSNPFRTPHPIWLVSSLAATSIGLWLVFWPPDTTAFLLGGPLIGLGSAVAAAQFALVRSLGLERQVAPAELQAWLKVALLVAALAVAIGNAGLLQEGFAGQGALRLGIMALVLMVLYVVSSSLLRVRQGANVVQDERDLQISARAAAYGRAALVFYLVSLTVMLGFSPPERLMWASPPVVAFHLLLAMLIGWVTEYVVILLQYWRDRR